MSKTRLKPAEPNEQRASKILEVLERLFKRPETRVDGQRFLNKLSPQGQTLAKYIVVSGPAGDAVTLKGCEFTPEQLEAALTEIETGFLQMRGGK